MAVLAAELVASEPAFSGMAPLCVGRESAVAVAVASPGVVPAYGMDAAYVEHAAAVYAAAYGVLRDGPLAADVVHDVFESAVRSGRYDPDRGSLRGYLCAMAHHRAVDVVRRRVAATRRDDRVLALADRVAPSAEDVVVATALAEAVRGALATLPEKFRRPIELAFFDGLSYRAVGQALALPEGTAKFRIRRGLAMLHAPMTRQVRDRALYSRRN